MKALIVCECREGRLHDSTYELLEVAARLGAEAAMVLVGAAEAAPRAGGRLHLAVTARPAEYDPELHRCAVLEAVRREDPDVVLLLHSSYGWDLAPRIAAALQAAQVSELVAVAEGSALEVACCNGKMRRVVAPATPKVVVTVQPGAFPATGPRDGSPAVEPLAVAPSRRGTEFLGHEAAGARGVELGNASVIVSAGRGVGKKENVAMVEALAHALGGELAASRPVVDAGWVGADRQVGSTGQTVAPKLYVACGISGAVQHLAGIKGADYVVAINKDRDAPIGEVADLLVVADLLQLVPALTARLGK
ncbi:MAG TPA: electron transfer flavoprotein subunit alpha/FixB family protein [Anaeromyxobacteraceae bacterium]|nr:electron transfer flavoprotein subunit alpha/FixB family protein [Anaeromyxobacteraceae bacterium]